jgi:hypothetical protein
MIRIPALILAAIGTVAFPWPLTAVFVMIAALFVPPVMILFGVLMDILYYVPGAYPVPLYTILGLVGFIIAEIVHSFMKARIMGA